MTRPKDPRLLNGKALESDAPLILEDLGMNPAARLMQKKGDYEAARAQADLARC